MNNHTISKNKTQNSKLKADGLQLTIAHLYPEEMNIYGDMGNIITLKQRCLWRGIDVEVINIGKGELKAYGLELEADLYFMGGGQDDDMYAVFDDMLEHKKEFLEKEVEDNKVFLLICGAFELFGKYFLDTQGRTITGLDILPIETKAPSDALNDRCLGNLVYELNPKTKSEINKIYQNNKEDTIVGFENHAGQVFFLEDKIAPIGEVIIGKGNNAQEKTEGAIFKNVFGSFTHGSLLPKNPHFADLLIYLSLKNKYRKEIKLQPLNDEIEWLAHNAAINRAK